jgi:chromosome partitioning protein
VALAKQPLPPILLHYWQRRATGLLDLDVYAPSLQAYFEADPKKWINDFLYEDAELKEVVLDFTPFVESRSRTSNNVESKANGKHGQLWIGFCNRKKEEIYKMDAWSPATGRQYTPKINLLRRFILLTELLSSEYQADYIIIDTSPGVRYWSINSLTVVDTVLLTLKMGDIDIDGTTQLVGEIYDSFTKFGTKTFLLWNRVSGYCVPHNVLDDTTWYSSASDRAPLKSSPSVLMENQQATKTNMKNILTSETRMELISAIPCYCDIQFSRREFLTVLDQPEHPFTKEMEQLLRVIETI